MTEPSEAMIDALATYRLTRLVVTDTFPPVQIARFRILQKWKPGDWRVELLTCPWCISFWIGLGTVVARRWLPEWRWIARALAFSAVAGILTERQHG